MAKKKRKAPKPESRSDENDLTPEAAEALDVIAEMERTIEDDISGEAYRRGEDFFESVMEKAKSIGATITRTGRCSDAQRGALDNMHEGIKKWVHDDD